MILLTFIALQLGDLATTLLFLRHGVAEGNPLISAALRLSTHPALPLAAVKLAGCALALYCWRTGRATLLRRINLFFAACVVWNLAALTAQ
jgi:hypothetical protein